MTGIVLNGTRNVFTVLCNGEELECRIKGKVLKGMEGFYNALAPGDEVSVEPSGKGEGLITSCAERKNLLARFNQKGQKPQALAANVDILLCFTTPSSPPFRPRFLDRVLVQAEASGIEALIVCNKCDLPAEPETEERLADYERAGYQTLRVSAKTGMEMQSLAALIAGKKAVFMGQSGVGKSSVINALDPSLNLKTGAVNEKYDRGNHTTTMPFMLRLAAIDAWVIDTPGIRRMVPWGVAAGDLALYMKEFAPFAGRCSFGLSCSHRGESGCKITEAVAAGTIHPDRYESFLRITDELEQKDS